MPDERGSHYCPQCGYDLRGQTVERCPECGFHYDKPALESLARARFESCLGSYTDALPLLASAALLVLVGGSDFLEAMAGPRRSWRGLLTQSLLMGLPLLMFFVEAWLRVWVLWPLVLAEKMSLRWQGTWREALYRLSPAYQAEGQLIGVFARILLYFVCVWGLLPSPLTAWFSGAMLLIGGYWTALGTARRWDFLEKEPSDRPPSPRAISLRRANLLCWTLLAIGGIAWLVQF